MSFKRHMKLEWWPTNSGNGEKLLYYFFPGLPTKETPELSKGPILIQTLTSKTLSLVEEVLLIREQQDITEKLPSELHDHMILLSFLFTLSLVLYVDFKLLLSLQIYCPNTYDPIINIQGQAYNKQ